MPAQNFALQRGEEKRLLVTWNVGWKNILIELDGKKIGTIATRSELVAGKTITLPDKSQLRFRLNTSIINSGLAVSKDDIPLPDSPDDPLTTLRGGYVIGYMVAVYNMLMGFLTVVFKLEALQKYHFGYLAFFLGVAYFILARFISKKSLIALIAFIALFSLETILQLFSEPTIDVMIRFIIIYYISLSFAVLKKLKKEEKPEQIEAITEL
ncbi:MAG: hypothetical protein JEZ00_14175 [Anaerolineaceae bacterium]|nr:hypothetical protein [Anaerolineaceae bacterium]